MAVVLVLRLGSCKDRHLAFLLRQLSISTLLHSFIFTAMHIAGCQNFQADALSRSDFQAFLVTCSFIFWLGVTFSGHGATVFQA